jgi:two-component system, NarL family, response regulator LiaR
MPSLLFEDDDRHHDLDPPAAVATRSEEQPLCVVLVDDETVVTETLALALEGIGEVEVHRSAVDLARCVALCRSVGCSVVVVALTGAEREIDLVRGLVQALPELRVVTMPNRSGRAMVSRALAAGAVGHLAMDASIRDVVKAVTVTCVGGSVLSGDRLRAAARRLGRERDDRLARAALTPRELEVLRLVALGMPTREVARQLSISLHTTRTHMQNTLTKLGLHSRLEAAAYANRLGLLDET